MLHAPALRNTRYPLETLAAFPAVALVATMARPFSLAEHGEIPWLLRRLGADLYHAPYYIRPYVGLPCPSVTTLYDAIPRLFPHEVSLRARLLFDLLTRLSIRASQRLLTISHSARADLVAAYAIPPEKIAVTPLAADRRFQPQAAPTMIAMRERYALPQPYVLCVSSNKPHKNLPLLVEAWAQVAETPLGEAHTLVLAGHWDDHYPAAKTLVEQHGLGHHVRFLPHVRDDDLPALYAGCTLFVAPSRYEGFGLPVLEALACGAAVICGATSSLPEVVGDAALVIDTQNAVSLAEGINRLLANKPARTQLRAAATLQAGRFSWRTTAEQTLAVYATIIESQ